MLQITPQHRLLLCVPSIDFRKGIDSLAASCQQHLGSDPFSGAFFVFANTRKTSVKLLIYDGNGFWLSQKRFSSGKLAWWPKTIEEAYSIRSVDLLIMLQQGDPKVAHVPEDWRRLPWPSPPDNSTATNVLD